MIQSRKMTNEHNRFWSKAAKSYDSAVDLQIGPNIRAMVLDRLTREQNLGKVVEFGCGTGFFTASLTERADSVLATDVAPGMLSVAEQKIKARNVKFQLEDCQEPSLPDATFDTVFLSLVIHFTEPAQTLEQMRRILKRGGAIIIANADPAALKGLAWFRWFVRGFYYGITRFRTKPPKDFFKHLVTEKQLCELLNQA